MKIGGMIVVYFIKINLKNEEFKRITTFAK